MKSFLRTNGMKPVGIFFCLLLFISFFSPPTAEGTVFFVTETGGAEFKDGISWGTALDEAGFIDKLKEAAVVSGDQFWVAAGTYRPSVSGEVAASFVMKPGVSLYGGFAGTEENLEERDERDWKSNETILTGDLDNDDNVGVIVGENSVRVVAAFGVVDSSAVLDGFTITAGDAKDTPPEGGGMRIFYGNPTISNCTFLGNRAVKGGGLYIDHGNPIITNCTFSGNTADNEDGGGLYVHFGNPTLMNCTFSGNSTDSSGGGLYVNQENPTLTNCTFSENTAINGGSALYVKGGNPTLTNCILWSENDDEVISGDVEPIIEYSVVKREAVFPGIGNRNDDPKLDSLADNGGPTMTCALLSGSPAIDAGTETGAPTTDQRGVTRPQGSGVDMGAFEFEPDAPLPPDKPELFSPASGDIDISLTPTLKTKPYPPASFDHTGTEWEIFDDLELISLVVSKDLHNAPLTEWVVSADQLDYEHDYFWRARFTDANGGRSAWSDVWTFTTMDAPIIHPNTPELEAPVNAATGISLIPLLEVGPYSHPSETDQKCTHWQISTQSTFPEDPDLTTEGQTDPGTQEWAVPVKLLNNTKYYWRARFEDTDGHRSEWSSPWSFTTEGTPVPVVYPAPDLHSPADGADGLSLTPTLEVEFPVSPSAPEGSRWQVALDSTFASPVAEGNLSGVTKKWTIPKKKLRYGTTYYWRVQSLITGGATPKWSDWSDTWSFTTEQAPGGGGSGGGCNTGAAGSVLLLLPLALIVLNKRI